MVRLLIANHRTIHSFSRNLQLRDYHRTVDKLQINEKNVEGMSSLKLAVGGLIFGSLVVGTGSLGVWQVQRYNWKINKINDRKDELRLEPLTMQQIISVYLKNNCEKECCAQPCEIEGYFDHERSLLIGRRGAPEGLVGEKPQGMATSPSGYYLCTVLQQKNGSDILVNRGWLPAGEAKRGEWSKPTGLMKLRGIISFGETKSFFSPKNQLDSGVALWTELPLLESHLNVDSSKWSTLPHPIMMELLSAQKATLQLPPQTSKSTTVVGPLWFVPTMFAFWRVVGDQTNESIEDNTEVGEDCGWPMCKSLKNYESFAVMPETHAVYAVTWFSLSLFGLVASMRLLRRKSPHLPSTPIPHPTSEANPRTQGQE